MRKLSYFVRPICEADIPQISEIDHEAFPGESMFRPFKSYKEEIHNSSVHYIVAYTDESVNLKKAETETGKPKWFQRLSSYHNLNTSEMQPNITYNGQYIIGFVGLWIMFNEAHITAIAIRKAYRSQGIGESLIISAIEKSAELGAQVVTLEVRVSNLVAQSLYLKYGFHKVGKRQRYYSDNNEDALLMTTDNITSDYFISRFQEAKNTHEYNNETSESQPR
jgi:ribosomal-protein-alanine N-acetyltransferase